MNTAYERILTIKLIEKINEDPYYEKKLGLSIQGMENNINRGRRMDKIEMNKGGNNDDNLYY